MYSELSSIAQDLRRFIVESLHSPCLPDDERFEGLALALFRCQYQLNRPYRALCAARGVRPESVSSWTDLPAVSTSAFKEFAFSCLEETERTTYFQSSGTTQSARSRNYHSRESLQLYHASLLPWFQTHLLPETAGSTDAPDTFDFASLTPSILHAPHSSLVHMLDVVSAQPWFDRVTFAGEGDPSGAWTLDVHRFLSAVNEAASANRTLLLTGTAFNFVHLLDALDGRPPHLPAGSRIMETGGYKGRSRELSKDALHAQLSEQLGIPLDFIVTEYGMTELGSQAYDRIVGNPSAGQRLKFPPWTRARVVSVETGNEVAQGEPGVVRVVDLANAFSVLAIESEDLAIHRANGIELLGRRITAEPRGCSLMAV